MLLEALVPIGVPLQDTTASAKAGVYVEGTLGKPELSCSSWAHGSRRKLATKSASPESLGVVFLRVATK